MSEKTKTTMPPKSTTTNGTRTLNQTFEFPGFQYSIFAMRSPFQDLARQYASQGKETLEALKTATDDMAGIAQERCSIGIQSIADYNLKAMQAARTNATAAFEFCRELMITRSPSEMAEISTVEMRRQLTMILNQNSELWALCCKLSANAATPPIEGDSNSATRM